MTVIRTVQEVAANPQPGDIYEGSWGYDQTNAEFWQVVKRTPSTVTIRQISMAVVGEGHSTRLVPVVDSWITQDEYEWIPNESGFGHHRGELISGKPIEKVCRLGRETYKSGQPGASLKMKSYYSVYPWDGQSVYDTLAAGFPGH